MKKVIFFLLISVSCFAQEFNFDHGGYNRIYLVHLPPNYDANKSYPLVLAFHGGLGKGSQLENQSQLSVKADEENFIVVYPDGVPHGILKIRTWNGGGCCGNAASSNIDDVGFVDNLIDTLLSNYSIDEKRVYSTGISNGAFLSYRLACELPHKIAAIAPVAGSMLLDECNASRQVPVCHIHSKVDGSIPYQGGVGGGLSNHYNPPIDSVLTVWKNKGNCQFENSADSTGYYYREYKNCDCDYEIEYYLTNDGGHSWAGGKKATGDTVSTAVNANDKMWAFFQKHTLDCSPSSIQSQKGREEIVFSNNILKWNAFRNLNSLSIYNVNGGVVIQKMIDKTGMIDLNGLKLGVYLVKINETSQKLVISK